jgi:NADH-quinone oxidoreductase subunit M
MIQKVFFGNTNTRTENARDIFLNEWLVLGALVVVIISLGVYPQPLLNLTNGFVDALMKQINLASII